MTEEGAILELKSLMLSSISLSLSTKQVHWVIHGTNFISIHRYLDEVHADLVDFADELAEWLVSEFNCRDFSGEASNVSENSRIQEIEPPFDSISPSVGASHIASRLNRLISEYRGAIKNTEDHPATQDILIAQKQQLVEHRWFLESEVA